jgi:hypothetical protein
MPETNGLSNYVRDYVNANGAIYISGATTYSAAIKAIYCIRNCQWTSITATNITRSTAISSGTSWVAGVTIRAKITKVKLKGGAALLYL